MSVAGPERATAIPRIAFEAPLFRGLDDRALRELEAASRAVRLSSGAQVYAEGATGESFYIVVEGRIELSSEPRPGAGQHVVRAATPGDSFGEEATVIGTRRSSASATTPSLVVEIPVHLFRRATVRSGRAEVAERLERTLRRAAARDLLGAASLGQGLDAESFDALLDAATFQSFGRGEPIYRTGEPALALFFVCDGMVQIQTEDDERLRVRAYLTRGDFFGDEELETATPRVASAVASGHASVLSIPARVVRALADRQPELFAGLRRVALGLAGRQHAIIGAAAKNATSHVFRDLYRLEVARSLLVIDLETCVRCGHCAWACASLYGTSRLVRRGDKIVRGAADRPAPSVATRADAGHTPDADFDVFRLRPSEVAGPKSLLLPSSCQHCENPACMVGCPTGAIGKDPSGEVFIKDELCTGCGACARACPWNNIQMAERPKTAARPAGFEADELAVKCDLCRTYDRGPACVEVCPVEAIFRVDPTEDLVEVAALFGRPQNGGARTWAQTASAVPTLLGAGVAAMGVGLVGAIMQARGGFVPGRGLGFAAGVAAALTMLALLAYAAPKRGVRRWMKLPKREAQAAHAGTRTRSVTRPHYVAHLALGMLAPALALAHAPGAPATAGGVLLVTLAVSAASGAFIAFAYALLPSRLARVERKPLLPEDFARERAALETRLFRALSGKSDLVKAIADKILLPYARSRVGPAWLLLGGRDLAHEERVLRARIERLLEGRGRERLAGLDDLVRAAVELRALPAQRALLASLRFGLPLHILAFSLALVLLVIHVIVVKAGFR